MLLVNHYNWWCTIEPSCGLTKVWMPSPIIVQLRLEFLRDCAIICAQRNRVWKRDYTDKLHAVTTWVDTYLVKDTTAPFSGVICSSLLFIPVMTTLYVARKWMVYVRGHLVSKVYTLHKPRPNQFYLQPLLSFLPMPFTVCDLNKMLCAFTEHCYCNRSS